jgi:hypothetical protein
MMQDFLDLPADSAADTQARAEAEKAITEITDNFSTDDNFHRRFNDTIVSLYTEDTYGKLIPNRGECFFT